MTNKVPTSLALILISLSLLVAASYIEKGKLQDAYGSGSKMHIIPPSACLKCHSDLSMIKAMSEKRGDLIIYSKKTNSPGKCPYIDVR